MVVVVVDDIDGDGDVEVVPTLEQDRTSLTLRCLRSDQVHVAVAVKVHDDDDDGHQTA